MSTYHIWKYFMKIIENISSSPLCLVGKGNGWSWVQFLLESHIAGIVTEPTIGVKPVVSQFAHGIRLTKSPSVGSALNNRLQWDEHSRTKRHCDLRTDTERIYFGWDYHIADASAYNRSFPCMKTTNPYAIKTQRKAWNAPSRGLRVPWAGFLWHKRTGVASQPIRAQCLKGSGPIRRLLRDTTVPRRSLWGRAVRRVSFLNWWAVKRKDRQTSEWSVFAWASNIFPSS